MKNFFTSIAYSKKTLIFLIAIGVFLNFFTGATSLDPDFGWHIKMGEYISSFGIPKGDPFSYTMPSFPFIDHEWLTNIYLYHLYSVIGYAGLASLFALIGVLAIIISLCNPLSRTRENSPFAKYLILFVVAFGTVIPYVGIRPQLQSWLFLSILLYVLFNERIWSKYKYFIPLLFIVWVNLHGSFGAGFIILGFVLFLRSIRKRKVDVSDVLVGGFSFIATLLTPYGYRNWAELLQQVTDSRIHWTISEWMPSIFSFNIAFIMLASLSSLVLWKYRKRFLLEETGLFLVLLYQAIAATRHVPLWALFAIPIASVGLDLFYKEIKNVKYGTARLTTTYLFSFWLILIIIGLSIFIKLQQGSSLRVSTFYPKDAVTYLKNNQPSQNVISEYGWGGYLIWTYPEKKVFIDGRMATWKWDKNPSTEEGYVFDTYQKMLSGEIPYQEVFQKYTITTVLWHKPQEKKTLDKKIEELENFFRKFFNKKDFNFLDELEKDGWQKVYEDEVSVIYQKP